MAPRVSGSLQPESPAVGRSVMRRLSPMSRPPSTVAPSGTLDAPCRALSIGYVRVRRALVRRCMDGAPEYQGFDALCDGKSTSYPQVTSGGNGGQGLALAGVMTRVGCRSRS